MLSGYIPSSTKWFRLASSGLDKISFTPTMVDNNSGVPYTTISQVVNVKINMTGSRFSESSPAVLGADLNVGFFQKLIEELMPECKNSSSAKSGSQNETRCFLVDHTGYVIYHPHLTKSLKTLSKVHMTQLEPLSVIDILQYSQNKHSVMQKQQCHKLSDHSATQGSLQRIYSLSMSKDGVRKNKLGDQSSRYSIVPVPKTNLFLGVVYDSCDKGTDQNV